MTPRGRLLAALLALAAGCGADVALWQAWTAICQESCAFALAPPVLVFMLVLPVACAAIAAWAPVRRRALPALAVLLGLALALTLLALFARGHAHGG
jgi:hypothetical protein